MASPLTLSVIVITYRRPDELRGVLENLHAQERPADEIIVIDNDPEGSGRAAVEEYAATVRYHHTGENLGVAAGRNLAIRLAQGEVLVFIDDDARFASADATRQILTAFDVQPQTASLALQVRNAFTQEIVPREYPGYSTARWNEPHLVSYFIGAATAIRRDVFVELRGFDETFFYGEEELDLSFRLINAGWQICYWPAVLAYHRVSPHGRESIRRNYGLIRNRLYLVVKHLPLPYLLSQMVLWGGFALVQAVRSRGVGEFLRGLRSLWADGLLQRAWAYRREHPMHRQALAYLRQHEGRLFY